MPKFVRLLFGVLALLACSAFAQDAPIYRGIRFDSQFTPKFVNDLGQVAGTTQDGKPVIWNRDGSVLQLPGAVSQLTITGFNSQGTMVGTAMIPGFSVPQPVAWRNGGAVERLPFTGLGGFVAGINNRGDIIGYMAGASNTGTGQVGFIQWGDGSAPQLFDNYLPQMINDNGLVLGQRSDAWGLRSWQEGVFGESLYTDRSIRGLNSEGRMAGSESFHAFSLLEWDGQRDMQELWFGFAHDINDAGSVVGETEFSLRGMLWYHDRAYALDHLWDGAQYPGWSLVNAWGINDSGDILARGVGPMGEDGQFLLSPLPVPEPGNVTLLLVGFALLATCRFARPAKLWLRRLLLTSFSLLACNAYAQDLPAYRAFKFDGQFVPQFLNDAGQVAGIGQDGKPLIWNPDGSIVHLPGVVSQLTLTGFNNHGTVIGNANIPGLGTQPVVWRNGGAMELLSVAGSGGSAAGINNRGDIVGYGPGTAGAGPLGFIQWADGRAPQLFDDYRPRLINDEGLVFGTRTDEFGYRSWREGEFGENRFPYDYHMQALNNAGALAGYQEAGSAFLLARQDGAWQRQDLWSPVAYDINDAGSVVGETHYRRAMLWFQDQPYALDRLWNEEQYSGWFLQSAWDINAGGQILARGTSEWEGYGLFLLSPVPEPAQAALLLAGLALLGAWGFRPVRRSA